MENFKAAMRINADLVRVKVEQEKHLAYARGLERAGTYDLREVVIAKLRAMELDKEIEKLEKERDGYLEIN